MSYANSINAGIINRLFDECQDFFRKWNPCSNDDLNTVDFNTDFKAILTKLESQQDGLQFWITYQYDHRASPDEEIRFSIQLHNLQGKKKNRHIKQKINRMQCKLDLDQYRQENQRNTSTTTGAQLDQQQSTSALNKNLGNQTVQLTTKDTSDSSPNMTDESIR